MNDCPELAYNLHLGGPPCSRQVGQRGGRRCADCLKDLRPEEEARLSDRGTVDDTRQGGEATGPKRVRAAAPVSINEALWVADAIRYLKRLTRSHQVTLSLADEVMRLRVELDTRMTEQEARDLLDEVEQLRAESAGLVGEVYELQYQASARDSAIDEIREELSVVGKEWGKYAKEHSDKLSRAIGCIKGDWGKCNEYPFQPCCAARIRAQQTSTQQLVEGTNGNG